ncbi:MAG: Xaa-Pro dipeptidase [Myxococcales bacterium]|nr:Xaa-Pro dipeptidase [Myxococcales bacterium]
MTLEATLSALYPDHLKRLVAAYVAVLERHALDAVVLHGGTAQKRTLADDQYWPIRPTPHFQHWVPLAEPDAAVVVEASGRAWVARVAVTSFWEHPFEPEGRHWEASLAQRPLARWSDLAEQLPKGRLAFVGDDLAAAAELSIAQRNGAALVADLDALRVYKTPYEKACLREANRRAALGHQAVLDAFARGAESELDLHLAYLGATGQDDPETPYKNIVALGPHAATLHHVSYGRHRAPRGARPETLLLDAGSTCMGYCSDITRTFFRDARGASASVFAELLGGMEALQKTLCAEVRVGTPYEALHDRSHALLGELLARCGVVQSAERAVDEGVTRAFYPHGLGHSLGLQCHDVGCALLKPRGENPFLRNTSVIAPDQVFTIEPGLYFIESLLKPMREAAPSGLVDWQLVDALTPFGGIRIEDDVVVTDDPARPIDNLTRPFLPDGAKVLS